MGSSPRRSCLPCTVKRLSVLVVCVSEHCTLARIFSISKNILWALSTFIDRARRNRSRQTLSKGSAASPRASASCYGKLSRRKNHHTCCYTHINEVTFGLIESLEKLLDQVLWISWHRHLGRLCDRRWCSLRPLRWIFVECVWKIKWPGLEAR